MSRVLVLLILASCPLSAWAQTPPKPQGAMQMPMPGMDHSKMGMMMPENPLAIAETRDGSGTSWLPDASPMHGVMIHKGSWMLMLHGNGFAQFINTGGARGRSQFGSVNSVMGMAQREAGGGVLMFRSMLSAEPLTVGRCGYPDLLQSGELCRGGALHDQQHPHDLFMELAADYRHGLSESVAFEVYGGLSGEPALGPTAFPHRLSAMPNPIAPIAHHWLDSSHISFGVITGGLYGRMWKAEASVFNGREPDDRRYNIDLAPLDSYSGRLWLLPSPNWALQVSAGHLTEAEVGEDVNRFTASATYHRMVEERVWATTFAWGQNREHDRSSVALTAETAADLTPRDTVFGRAEMTGKTAKDLVLSPRTDEVFNVGKLSLGYTRWLKTDAPMKIGVGGTAGLAVVPTQLSAAYGGRSPGEFSVFVTFRPR